MVQERERGIIRTTLDTLGHCCCYLCYWCIPTPPNEQEAIEMSRIFAKDQANANHLYTLLALEEARRQEQEERERASRLREEERQRLREQQEKERKEREEAAKAAANAASAPIDIQPSANAPTGGSSTGGSGGSFHTMRGWSHS